MRRERLSVRKRKERVEWSRKERPWNYNRRDLEA
jgi:hypothetical protein